MTPDPRAGRWLRAVAIAAVIALGVATCARSRDDAAAGDRAHARIVAAAAR